MNSIYYDTIQYNPINKLKPHQVINPFKSYKCINHTPKVAHYIKINPKVPSQDPLPSLYLREREIQREKMGGGSYNRVHSL